MSSQRFVFLLLPGLIALSLASHAQTKPAPGPTPTPLKPGKAVTQRLQGGQTYEYQATLKTGQVLKATAEQQGVDVVVTAYAPDGTKLGTFDSTTGTTYKEFVTVVAPANGRYRLAVSALEPQAPAGTFVLTLEGILTPAQYAQRQAEDRKQADAAVAYLRAPHPDKTIEEEHAEALAIYPSLLMVEPKVPEIEAARWLEGTWSATRKIYASFMGPETTLPASNRVIRFNPTSHNQLEMDREASGKFEPMMVFDGLSQQWVSAFMATGDAFTNWGLLKGTGWQNNQLVLEGETSYAGFSSHERRTMTKTDDRTFRVLTEERKGDGSWAPVSESTFIKTAPTGITATK